VGCYGEISIGIFLGEEIIGSRKTGAQKKGDVAVASEGRDPLEEDYL
jgi:hypothetical protein